MASLLPLPTSTLLPVEMCLCLLFMSPPIVWKNRSPQTLFSIVPTACSVRGHLQTSFFQNNVIVTLSCTPSPLPPHNVMARYSFPLHNPVPVDLYLLITSSHSTPLPLNVTMTLFWKKIVWRCPLTHHGVLPMSKCLCTKHCFARCTGA